MPKKTLFKSIIDKEIPADFLYEDELCIAIKDIKPKAPVHFLIIPRETIPSIQNVEPAHMNLLGHMILVAKKLAEEHNCEGYRLQFNVGEKGGQEIFHLHLHLLGWH